MVGPPGVTAIDNNGARLSRPHDGTELLGVERSGYFQYYAGSRTVSPVQPVQSVAELDGSGERSRSQDIRHRPSYFK